MLRLFLLLLNECENVCETHGVLFEWITWKGKIMGSFIAKQPNGLICRFSTVVDCTTHWNMTEEDYIELCAEWAREEARHRLDHYIQPFEMMKEYFSPGNMTQEEFDKFLEDTFKEIKEV